MTWYNNEKLKFRVLPLGGSVYDGGISYLSQSDSLLYVLLLRSNGSLMRYNITKDTLKKLTTLPRQMTPSQNVHHHFTLDIDNNILYFVDDWTDNSEWYPIRFSVTKLGAKRRVCVTENVSVSDKRTSEASEDTTIIIVN